MSNPSQGVSSSSHAPTARVAQEVSAGSHREAHGRARFYLGRARELRGIAARLRTPETRQNLIAMAAEYELMATRLQSND